MILAIKDFSNGKITSLVITNDFNDTTQDLIFRRKIIKDSTNVKIHSIKLENIIYTIGDITNLGRISYIDIKKSSYELQLFNYNTKCFELVELPNDNIKVYKKVMECDNGSLYECDMEKTIKSFFFNDNENGICSKFNVKLKDYINSLNVTIKQPCSNVIENTETYEINYIKFI